MIDPILIYLVFFGSPLVGLIEGLVRKRGWMGTIINILVAGAFGIGAAVAVPKIVNPGWAGAVILLYLAPIVGSSIGVLVVLRIFRRERWSAIGELLKVAAYFVVAVVLLLGLVEGSFYLFAGSSRIYTTVHSEVPATLAAWQMASAERITVAVSTAHAVPGTRGTLNTATAADIVAATRKASIKKVQLRIINVSSNVTWAVTAGEGVTLHGTMTIAPNAWRNFRVTPVAASAVSIQSIGGGVCPSGVDPSSCDQ